MSAPVKYCPRCATRKPLDEFGKDTARGDGKRAYCLECDREAARGQVRPRTADRMLRSRAVNRAMAQLRDRHRQEYDALYAAAIEAARLEAAEHAAAATVPAPRGAERATVECPPPPVPLLKPGPAQIGQVEPRLRTDVGTCPLCVNRHDRGHVCPSCGSRPQLAGPIAPAPRLVRVEDLIG